MCYLDTTFDYLSQWRDVDGTSMGARRFSKGRVVHTRENVKDNVNEMMVYLSPFALNQFRLLFEETGDTEWCFPAKA
jgi:hypothetical protein